MEGKKSFILYADLIHTVNKLPNEMAGKLFKVILDYVNDKNPDIEAMDFILQIAFEPIRQQLKRDLQHWSNVKKVRAENGRKGGLAKKANAKLAKQNLAKGSNTKQHLANVAVNVNDTVNVNDIKKKSFIPPTLLEVQEYFQEKGYTKESAKKAFDYYSVANWHDSTGKQIKNWKQKVIAVWFKEENKINNPRPNGKPKLAI